MVVVPTMLLNAAATDDLLEQLEIRYLANRDSNLHFALLTDLRDAPQAVMPGDNELVRQAREGIESLNRKYEHDRPDIFFLFHRPRLWNEHDRVWMGYERKRGKLKEFTAILRGGSRTAFKDCRRMRYTAPSPLRYNARHGHRVPRDAWVAEPWPPSTGLFLTRNGDGLSTATALFSPRGHQP